MSTTNSMKATEIIDALQQAKSDIKTALGDVKVTVIEQDYPEVTTAIRGFFGDSYVKDGVAVITCSSAFVREGIFISLFVE